VLDGAFVITLHFQQMSPNRVETIVPGKPVIAIEGTQQFDTLCWTVSMAAAIA